MPALNLDLSSLPAAPIQSGSVSASQPKSWGRSGLPEDGSANDFDQVLAAAGQPRSETSGARSGGRDILNGVLRRHNLSLPDGHVADSPFSFGSGFSPATAVNEALDLARANLPGAFKQQIGRGLIALGRTGSSPNSMLAGAALMGAKSSGEALAGVLDDLKGELGLLKLDKSALDDLGDILSSSGVEDERINEILADLAAGELKLTDLQQTLARLDLSGPAGGGGLTADDEGGLSDLGQFLGSLGASTEAIDAVLNAFAPGEPVTAAALRGILDGTETGGLAADLSGGDIESLRAFLVKMGARPNDLKSLNTLLEQTQGHLSVKDFLGFIEGLENSPAQPVTQADLNLVKSLLEKVSRETELAKTPLFNETLVKLQALGDDEIDSDFIKLSPALQALRGGISGAGQNASFGGQSGQFAGQRQNQGSSSDRESKERYRQALHSVSSGADAATPAGSIHLAEAAQTGYSDQREALAKQISQKMLYSHRRGLHRLKMNLNPAELGRLDIELKVQDGKLTANIRAANREAYEALTGEIEDLKEALAKSGVDVDNITLSLGNAENGTTEIADLGELKQQAESRAEKKREHDRAALNAARRQSDLDRVV